MNKLPSYEPESTPAIDQSTPLSPEEMSSQIKHLEKALNGDSDVACALVATSFLEQCLRTLIYAFTISGSDKAKNLCHFSKGVAKDLNARATLGYCLGLVDEQLFKHITTMGEIRNLFAHKHYEMSFSHADVAEKCQSLSLPKVSGTVVSNASFGNSSIPPSEETVQEPLTQEVFETCYKTPRARFMIVAIMSATRIILTSLAVDRCSWPPRYKEPITTGKAANGV